MRLISGILLMIAVLALVLWITAAASAGIAKIITAMFLTLFVISLFLRKGRPGKL